MSADEEIIIPVTTEETPGHNQGDYPNIRTELGPVQCRYAGNLVPHYPMHHRGSRYEFSGGMGVILEDPGPGPGWESEIPEYFLDTRLGILEWCYDLIMQTFETTLALTPRLVGEAIQRELRVQPVGPLAGLPGGLPTTSPAGPPAASPAGPSVGPPRRSQGSLLHPQLVLQQDPCESQDNLPHLLGDLQDFSRAIS
ncbi:UNVERIFIED_CONTAM: hypothetical protein K2H54_047886 [Gekko kuhli]